MQYTAVIRTLGKSGELYQQTLDSLMQQTIKPVTIVVYIAEGYPIPKETVGIEQYVYVKKGMVAQRALQYNEVATEYILFLDDDIYLPPYAVEKLYNEMVAENGQVIAPCTFPNHEASFSAKLRKSLIGKEVCRFFKDDRWAFKVLRTAGFSYNNNPIKAVYESQTNAGNCFLCCKKDFLKTHYEEELWLDETPYALPDDQVMFYKMHLQGLKILTSFDSGIIHLDAGSTMADSKDRMIRLIYSEYRNKFIFWKRFLCEPEKNTIKKASAIIALTYVYTLQAIKQIKQIIAGNKEVVRALWNGVRDGMKYCKSKEYKDIPKICKQR